MIIGITGRKGSGKNLVAKILQAMDAGYKPSKIEELLLATPYTDRLHLEETNWTVQAFARKVKEVVGALSGDTVEDIDRKKTELYPIPLGGKEVTYRGACQYIGTDLFRKDNPNVWTDALMVEYDQQMEKNDPIYEPNWIITDVRFPNEVQKIRERGGTVIKVERFTHVSELHYTKIIPERQMYLFPNHKGSIETHEYYIDADKEDFHESEMNIDYLNSDYTIYNKFSLKELIHSVINLYALKEKSVDI